MVGAGGDATAGARGPQSTQSVPSEHAVYVEPAPPSSHMPSLVQEHVLVHPPVPVVGAGAGGDEKQAAYAEHDPQKDGALEHMDGTLTQLASGAVAQYEKATHAA